MLISTEKEFSTICQLNSQIHRNWQIIEVFVRPLSPEHTFHWQKSESKWFVPALYTRAIWIIHLALAAGERDEFCIARDAAPRAQIARASECEREKRAQKAPAFLCLRPRIAAAAAAAAAEEQVERIVCLYLIPAVAPCNGGGCGANFSRDPIVMHIQTALKK